MNALVRKHDALASYLYLASLSLYMLPTIYLFLNPVGKMPAPIPIILFLALFLWFLIAVGVKLRAGKLWAKIVVLLNAVGMVVFCLYAVPTLFHSSYFTVLRTLAFLALNLATIFFLFKAYRAEPKSGVTPGGA